MTELRSGSAGIQAEPSRRSRQSMPKIALWHICVLLGALTMIYPVIWMIVSSLRPEHRIFGNPSLVLQEAPLWANYITGWFAQKSPFGTYMLNSTILATASVAGNILSCSMAAYALSRLSFPGRRLAIAIVIGTLLLPGYVTFVSQYVIFAKADLVNTFVPLLLPKYLAVDSFFVFLMMQFIRGIPRELDQAARIDGCGPIKTYFVVILPLIKPALATTAIFTFLAVWNDFLSQLVYLSKDHLKTVSVAIAAFGDPDATSDYGPMFAMGLITLLPMFIIFTVFQRSLVQGIASTGFK